MGTAGFLNAEWGQGPHDYIRLPLSSNARICSDGNGGCWASANNGPSVGLCHVDRNGNLTWEEPLYMLPDWISRYPKPVLADDGDVIIAMKVNVEPNDLSDVYLQRVNLDRDFLWGEDGIAIDTSSRIEGIVNTYKGPVDDTYLVHWVRRDANYQNYDTRLQLINGDGESLWGIGGVALNWPHVNSRFAISSDQCVIIAQNVAPTPSVEIVKIDPEGERVWDSILSTLWEDVRARDASDIESDRTGGVILLYKYERYENIVDSIKYLGINVLRISSDGDSLWTRQVYEREKEEPDNRLVDIDLRINYAGSGRFFVAWMDYPHTFQVVALDIDGENYWDEPVDVILNPADYGKLDAVDSDSGVCYLWRDVWGDRENGGSVQQWGQRISLEGERLWGARGQAVQARNVDRSSITTDGNGGVITVVEYNPTVQMINRNGEIGVLLEVGVDDDTGIHKSFIPNPQLYIYPNPGNSQFTIEFATGIPNEMFNYCIYNLMGRTITTGMMFGSHHLVNDLTRFSSGVYILQLQSPRMTVSKRFSLIK